MVLGRAVEPRPRLPALPAVIGRPAVSWHRPPGSRAATTGLVLAVLLLAGCAGPGPSPAPTVAPSAVAPSEGAEGLVSALPEPPATARPTTPAPSTAGDLSAASLPASYLGFAAKERPPAEDEYIPNGTWVHGLPADRAATEALPTCPGNTGATPVQPAAALMGSYLDASGRPGNGLALSFDSAAKATAYATAYRQLLATCTEGATTARELGAGDGWYAGRRSLQGTRWTEGIGVRGSHLLLMIVQDDDRSSVEEATAAARSLSGR